MSSKARVSVAIVRPTCPFFPRDWSNQPQTGEVQKIEPAVSLRIAQGVVSAFNRMKLAEAGNDARRRRQTRWAVIVDGKATQVVGNKFFLSRVRD